MCSTLRQIVFQRVWNNNSMYYRNTKPHNRSQWPCPSQRQNLLIKISVNLSLSFSFMPSTIKQNNIFIYSIYTHIYIVLAGRQSGDLFKVYPTSRPMMAGIWAECSSLLAMYWQTVRAPLYLLSSAWRTAPYGKVNIKLMSHLLLEGAVSAGSVIVDFCNLLRCATAVGLSVWSCWFLLHLK